MLLEARGAFTQYILLGQKKNPFAGNLIKAAKRIVVAAKAGRLYGVSRCKAKQEDEFRCKNEQYFNTPRELHNFKPL